MFNKLPIGHLRIIITWEEIIMDVSSASGTSAQYQASAAKTALNVQKQQGNNAIQLIQSAAEISKQTARASGSSISVIA
jgi:ferric-dicitrate binding protein FerR (iron transport regulator)